MKVNYYYDWTGRLTNDDEGNLVQLCKAHAEQHESEVGWASRGDPDGECELCEAAGDDPQQTATSAALDLIGQGVIADIEEASPITAFLVATRHSHSPAQQAIELGVTVAFITEWRGYAIEAGYL